MAKSDSLLPNPYGDESSFGQVSESALSRRVRIRDSQRVFWTRISTLPTTSGLRTILSVAAICYVVVLFSGRGPGNEQVGVALFAFQSALFAPALFASSFAQMSARDRLQLKAEGKKTMEAYPGVERILNTLHERVLRERTRLLCSIVAALAVNSSDDLYSGTILSSFLFGLAIFLGSIALLNTMQLERRIPMRDEDFPLLSLHAPTLHQSTLDRVLSDLVVAHLDPETAGHWDDWVDELENKVRSSQTPASAVEHLLRVLHLNHLGLLDDLSLIHI